MNYCVSPLAFGAWPSLRLDFSPPSLRKERKKIIPHTCSPLAIASCSKGQLPWNIWKIKRNEFCTGSQSATTQICGEIDCLPFGWCCSSFTCFLVTLRWYNEATCSSTSMEELLKTTCYFCLSEEIDEFECQRALWREKQEDVLHWLSPIHLFNWQA